MATISASEGHRVLGVAYRDCGTDTQIKRESEEGMIFLGFVVLSDPPKAGVEKTIHELKELGIGLKIITGDNALIAEHIAHEVGLKGARILTGPEMRADERSCACSSRAKCRRFCRDRADAKGADHSRAQKSRPRCRLPRRRN